MTLKAKIDALKKAAIGIDLPSDDDTFEDKQRRRLEKQRRFGITPKIDAIQKRIDKLGNPKTTTQAEENARNQYINFGTKIRPPKTAQENKERLRQLFANEDTAIEDFKRLKNKEREDFSFDPRQNKKISNEEARGKYGKPGVSMHYIPITNNPKEVDELSETWKKIHAKREAKEEKRPPHFIGVWHDPDENYKKYTDISYIVNTNDRAEVERRLQETNQKSSYTVHPSGKVEYIKNPKYQKPKETQEP